MAVLIALFSLRGAGCLVEGEPCDPREPAEIECDDFNDCTEPFCKRIWTWDCDPDYPESDYWCRYTHKPDGTYCVAIGKKDGACMSGYCRPIDLIPEVGDAGIANEGEAR